jgi:type I restriction enzyme S subunit
MQTSLNKFAETLSNNRIDADFFKPEYIRSYTSVVSKKNTSLAGVAHISDGNHLKIAEEFSNVSGVRYLRGQDISTDMMLSDRNIVYIPDSSFKTLKRSHIYKNDILITIVGANTGLVGLVYSPPEKLVASCKLGIIRPRKILSGYLYTFLITKYGQHQVFRNIRGGGQTGLILPDLKKIKVVRLGEDFEKLIHDIVYRAHKNANESLTIYNQAEQILLSELGLLNWKPKHRLSFIKNFSNTKSVDRVDAEYFQPMYEEIIKAVKSSKQYASLGDIISIKKCIEPGSEAYQDDGVPFVRVSNLSKIGINNDNQQYLSESLYETLKMHQPKKGEILLSKDATPGIAYYLKDTPIKMIPSGGILRLAVKDMDSVYPEYLTLVLNSVVVQKQIERDAGGSIINHWLVDQVRNTLVPILPASVQKRISEKVAESFSNREQSKRLLDIAKRGVEIAIEKSEKDAEKWIAEEMNKNGTYKK